LRWLLVLQSQKQKGKPLLQWVSVRWDELLEAFHLIQTCHTNARTSQRETLLRLFQWH
jgi:hypothetical protein